MSGKIALLTIGQSPRYDLADDFAAALSGIDFCEYGALDNLSMKEMESYFPDNENAHILTTTLLDGTVVKLDKYKIIPLLQKKLNEISQSGISVCVLLCTSLFPSFSFAGLLLEPGTIIYKVLDMMPADANIVALVPTKAHIPQTTKKYAEHGYAIRTHVVSPYSSECRGDEVAFDASTCIVYDCASYRNSFTKKLREQFNFHGPVFNPLQLTLAIAKALSS